MFAPATGTPRRFHIESMLRNVPANGAFKNLLLIQLTIIYDIHYMATFVRQDYSIKSRLSRRSIPQHCLPVAITSRC